ncbi:quinoprotein relay system zinc metallohydrolase 1 [Tsuneonella sp. HG094]
MKFSRRAAIAGALALPAAARAEQYGGTYAPVAEPVADGVWLVRGADEAIGFANGGAIANGVILASDAGAILYDAGPSLGYGKALANLAEQVTGKQPAAVYLSHLHPDHAFGAGAFGAAQVHALPGTRTEIERDGSGFSDAMYRMLSGWMTGTEVILPTGDVADGPVTIGGRRLRLFALAGHSGADLALLDEATGTLIAGDLVFHDRAPATPHAHLPTWRASLSALKAIPHKALVPGHGPLDRQGRAIAQTRDWLDWLEGSLRDAVARGLDMTEAGAMPIPDRFAKMQAARYELQRSVVHFYPVLEAEMLPRVDG